jgi:hypothetical protein
VIDPYKCDTCDAPTCDTCELTQFRKLKTERDKLKAERDEFEGGCEALANSHKKLKSERDALRALLNEWVQSALITRWHPSLTKKTQEALGEEEA